AEQAHDRAPRPAAGVRGGAARVLTFTCAAATVEIEVWEHGAEREITGRLVPPSPGTVRVRHRDLPPDGATARAETAGTFWVPSGPEDRGSLGLRLDDGTSIVTSWVRLGRCRRSAPCSASRPWTRRPPSPGPSPSSTAKVRAGTASIMRGSSSRP